MTTFSLARTMQLALLPRMAFHLGVLAALAGVAEPALGAPTPAEIAVAEALFREGKELLAAGKVSQACPKLAESLRIDPAGGTLIALGLCFEADGKTASAWVTFGEALAVAQRDNRADREKLARDKIADLEKKLSYLTVNVAPEAAALSGLEIKRGTAVLGKAALGTAVPVDPGKHRIAASAPGYQEMAIEVEVGPGGDRKTALIPALQPLPAAAPVAPATPTPPVVPSPPAQGDRTALPPEQAADQPDPGKNHRIAGWALGGAGLVTAGVGGVFGLSALSKHNDAVERCPESPCADAEGVDQNEDAKKHARAANVLVGVGLGMAAAGTVLLLIAPRAAAPSKAAGASWPAGGNRPSYLPAPAVTAIEPVVGSRGAAVLCKGRF